MARTVIFDSPYLLGFDHTRALIERLGRVSENYPPYNVEALSAHHIRISVAVAGFTADHLKLALTGQLLTLTAQKDSEPEDTEAREFLHRGIAQRGFSRSFVIGDGMKVTTAVLEYGLLHIDLKRPEPDDKVKLIPIISR
jgi:HSP20 family molecular chaperone IbpA